MKYKVTIHCGINILHFLSDLIELLSFLLSGLWRGKARRICEFNSRGLAKSIFDFFRRLPEELPQHRMVILSGRRNVAAQKEDARSQTRHYKKSVHAVLLKLWPLLYPIILVSWIETWLII